MASRKSRPFSFLAKNKKPNRSTHRKSGSIGFETLEKREVMAANLMATLSNGVLTIEGTPYNDTITVRNDGTKVSIDGALINQNTGFVNFGGPPQASVARWSVTSVVVNGLGGNDNINTVETSGSSNPLPMTVNGGWGNDIITGGWGSDKLNGFAGPDDAAANYDNSLGLYIDSGGEYLNSGNRQEKWLRSATNGWYFVLPDGSLYRQTQSGHAVGSFVYKFDPSCYTDLSQLADAGSGAAAAALDKAVNLISYGNLYENSGGRQERWVQDWNNQWYFITPDGALYRQTQSGYAIGTLEAKLDPTYWTQISKLLSASSKFTDVDTIDGGWGNDTITGGGDVDTLVGGEGNDVIHGNAGDDFVWGGFKDNVFVASGLNDGDRIWGDAGHDQLHGGNGIDRIWGDVGDDTIWGDWGNDFLYGGSNNDFLYGGDGDDQIWGDYGVDQLYGGRNNDWLYGGADYDYLYGEHGADWLDAGAAVEYANGGNNGDGSREFDINAWVTAVNGAHRTDIDQGAEPTCYISASMAAVSMHEVDLSQRITYMGNFVYKVNLWDRKDRKNPAAGYGYQPQYVTFDGSRTEGVDTQFNSQEGETWMIIMHRAILQMMRKWNPAWDPQITGNNSSNVLPLLTGKSATRWSVTTPTALAKLVSSGRPVTIATHSTASTLVIDHVYAVVAVSGNIVELYNPHGNPVLISFDTLAKDMLYAVTG